MPSLVEIGPAFLEKKIFEGFLPYIGIAAILVMWPGLFINKLVPPSIKFGFDCPSGFREDV